MFVLFALLSTALAQTTTTILSSTTVATTAAGATNNMNATTTASTNTEFGPGVPVHEAITTTYDQIAADAQFQNSYLSQSPAESRNFRNELLVFLPDTNLASTEYTEFLETCAGNGYHCVVLAYPNTFVGEAKCSSTGGQCLQFLREEMLTGAPKTAQVTIKADDAIETRLSRLLDHLASEKPTHGWRQFTDGAWRNSTSFAGDGEGGTMATFWACRSEAPRVLLFNAPRDYNRADDKLADWLSGPCRTPRERFYTFVHTNADDCARIQASFDALGLSADVVEVRAFVPEVPEEIQDFCALGRQHLCSSLGAGNGLAVDGPRSLVQNGYLRTLDDGTIEYRRVWNYMLADNECAKDENPDYGSCACEEGGLSGSEIGLIIGLIVFICLIVGIGGFVFWRKRKNSDGF